MRENLRPAFYFELDDLDTFESLLDFVLKIFSEDYKYGRSVADNFINNLLYAIDAWKGDNFQMYDQE